MSYIGFLLFLLGAGGMDSPNRTVPVIMVLVGLALVVITSIKENSSTRNSRPKQT